MALRRVTEIEKKLAGQTVEQVRGPDTSQSTRRIGVLQRSLARAKSHVAFIEHKIAVDTGDADTRSDRAALINSLIAKHSGPR